MPKRKIVDELMEGVAAMGAQRRGKITLRGYKVKLGKPPKVDSSM